jgi:acetoin utilization protein AcuB
MRNHATCGTVGQWMTRRPLVVAESCPIATALGQMRSAGVRHLVVVDDDRVTGILSTRDVGRLLADAEHAGRLSDPVREIMSEGPVTVAPEAPVTVAARVLLDAKIGALPVRDDDAVVGIFTTSDALEALLTAVDFLGQQPRTVAS